MLPLYFLKIYLKRRFWFKVFVGDHWWASFFTIYARCCHNIKKDSSISHMQVSKRYRIQFNKKSVFTNSINAPIDTASFYYELFNYCPDI